MKAKEKTDKEQEKILNIKRTTVSNANHRTGHIESTWKKLFGIRGWVSSNRPFTALRVPTDASSKRFSGHRRHLSKDTKRILSKRCIVMETLS